MPRRNLKKKTLPGGPHFSLGPLAPFRKKPWASAQGFTRDRVRITLPGVVPLADDPGEEPYSES